MQLFVGLQGLGGVSRHPVRELRREHVLDGQRGFDAALGIARLFAREWRRIGGAQ